MKIRISAYNCNKGVIDRYRVTLNIVDAMHFLVENKMYANVYGDNEFGFNSVGSREDFIAKVKAIA